MDEWSRHLGRFYNSTTIIGTQKLHSFIPVSDRGGNKNCVNPI